MCESYGFQDFSVAFSFHLALGPCTSRVEVFGVFWVLCVRASGYLGFMESPTSHVATTTYKRFRVQDLADIVWGVLLNQGVLCFFE